MHATRGTTSGNTIRAALSAGFRPHGAQPGGKKTMKAFTPGKALVAGMGLLLAAGTLAPQKAQASPAFARQQGLSCNTCHFQDFPAINSFGQRFKRNGYIMPNDQEVMDSDSAAGYGLLRTMNMAVIAKVRSLKTNGGNDDTGEYANTDANFGEIQWPDEAAWLIGGQMTEDVGYLAELNIGNDAASFLSTKFLFNAWESGSTKVTVVPFSTDGLGPGYGMELLNTGAQKGQRPVERHPNYTPFSMLGTGNDAATGVAFAASGSEWMVNYTPWAPSWGGTTHSLKGNGDPSVGMGWQAPGHYLRAAWLPKVAGWDLGIGFQMTAGTPAAIATRDIYLDDGNTDDEVDPGDTKLLDAGDDVEVNLGSQVFDFQAQGNMGGMPLGIYASYGQTSGGGDLTDNDSLVNDDGAIDGGLAHAESGPEFNYYGPHDETAMGVLAKLGVVPGLVKVFAGYGNHELDNADSSALSSVMLGGKYMFADNLQLEVAYTTFGGDTEDFSKDSDQAGGGDEILVQLFAGF